LLTPKNGSRLPPITIVATLILYQWRSTWRHWTVHIHGKHRYLHIRSHWKD